MRPSSPEWSAPVGSGEIQLVVPAVAAEQLGSADRPQWGSARHRFAAYGAIANMRCLYGCPIPCRHPTVVHLSWLLWRRSKEPKVGAQVSTLLMIGFWTPFYWITFVFPDASLAANQENPAASAVIVDWLPWPLYYNVLVGTILLTMAGVGYWVFRGGKVGGGS